MKILTFILSFIICLAETKIVLAQEEGSVIYETKVNMHRNIPPERAEMKEMIPEYNSYKSKLAFRGSESFYSAIEEDVEESFGDDQGARQVRIRRPDNRFYSNHANRRKVEAREFFGKYFIIEDSIRILPWRLSDETKNIIGYACRKATWTSPVNNQRVVAWYTDKLSAVIGPEGYNNLPGAVLQVDINEGERMITAEAVSFNKLAKGDLDEPTKGEKVTEAQFQKMLQEHRKRMGGNVMIRN